MKTTKLQKQNNVEIFNNVSVKDIFYQGDRITTKQNNFYVNTNILFACDGKNSSIRKIFKTPIYRKDYKKIAAKTNNNWLLNGRIYRTYSLL